MLRLGALVLFAMFTTIALAPPVRAQDDVILPDGAIDASEMLDESGVSQSVRTDLIELTDKLVVIESSTITAPTAGYVLAIGSGESRVDHTFASGDDAVIAGISSDCLDGTPTLSADQGKVFEVPSDAASGVWRTPFSAQKVFLVSSGANTLCVVAAEGGTGFIANITLSLLFIPTAYGTVAN